MRVLKAFKQSPMAIDINCWLTYRMSYLKNMTSINWGVLQVQFGASYKEIRQFKRRFVDQLKRVIAFYPVNMRINSQNLILLPCKTHINKYVKATAFKSTPTITHKKSNNFSVNVM
jgi:hypothetical protein